ncbi:hypothetical protein ACPXBD_09925, partial [Escherichia coli]
DRNRSHWSTSKTPSYTKSVSWQHHQTAEGQYAIPFKAKYLKLTDNSVQSGDVLSSLVMRVAQD